MNRIHVVLGLILSFLCLLSCHHDSLSDKSVIYSSQQSEQYADIARCIDKYFIPYNIEVVYHWDGRHFPLMAYGTPPKIEKILPTLEMIKTLWLDLYTHPKLGGNNFLKEMGIIRIVLVGEQTVDSEGVLLRLWNSQDSSNEIFLYGVNNFDNTKPQKVYALLRSIHHQTARRILERFPYDSRSFSAIAPNSYGPLTLPYDANSLERRIGLSPFAHRRGFYTLYGLRNPQSDLAEIISVNLLHSGVELEQADKVAATPTHPELESSVFEAKEAHRQLNAKQQFAEQYFKQQVGLSLKRMQLLSLTMVQQYNNSSK